MPLIGEYEPSPTSWVREQVETYEASGGTRGNTIPAGAPVVILTSKGVRSGKLRKTPLIRVEHDGCYLAIASVGGAAENPSWYFNVLAYPHVDLQDGPERRDMTARSLEGEERSTWWARAAAVFPEYDVYQLRAAERVIPVFLLEPFEPTVEPRP